LLSAKCYLYRGQMQLNKLLVRLGTQNIACSQALG
jgi:hypothetical protein